MSVSRDFEELFACLNAHQVRAVIVGAYAVAFHAKPRFTKDIDIFVEPAFDNAEKLVAALTDFGFGSIGLNAADFAVPGKVVQLGYPPNRVDLLTAIDGVDFETAWRGRVSGRYGAASVSYLGKTELIRNKTASARPQDLMDLTALRD